MQGWECSCQPSLSQVSPNDSGWGKLFLLSHYMVQITWIGKIPKAVTLVMGPQFSKGLSRMQLLFNISCTLLSIRLSISIKKQESLQCVMITSIYYLTEGVGELIVPKWKSRGKCDLCIFVSTNLKITTTNKYVKSSFHVKYDVT